MEDRELRELLELAALAAGIEGKCDSFGFRLKYCRPDGTWYWRPRDDDGDSLRLAVKLGMEIAIHETYSGVIDGNLVVGIEQHGDDPYAATRLAVLKCAAEIGRRKRE